MMEFSHMKRLLALVACLLLTPGAAFAQSTANQVATGFISVTGCLAGQTTCFIPTGGVAPVKGFGTLAVTSTSALVSTLTAGPNSAVWPTSPAMVYFTNAGASALFLCPLGGTCSATTGIPIAAAATLALFNPATTATVISASTGSLVSQW